MPTTIKLSDELITEARRMGAIYSRSVPKQIEYWSRIGKIAEENPDMPFNEIKGLLISMQEEKEGLASSFRSGPASS